MLRLLVYKFTCVFLGCWVCSFWLLFVMLGFIVGFACAGFMFGLIFVVFIWLCLVLG